MASRLGQVSTQLKSPPDEKPSPAAPTTITRTAGSAVKVSTASTMARAVPASKAFIALGRLSVRVATPSSIWVRTVEVIEVMGGRSHAKDAEFGRADRLVHRC